MKQTSSARVITADWTESSFSRSTADLFEVDTLTISAIDDDAIMRIFEPGTWRHATVYGDNGYPLFAFSSHLESARR